MYKICCYNSKYIINDIENSIVAEHSPYGELVNKRGYGITSAVRRKGAKMAEKAAKEQTPRIRIRLKAYDYKVIDQSAKQIIDTAIRTGANVSGPVPLPTRRSVFTVVKSPHVYKKGGEAFEMRVHKRLIDITNATPKTIDSLQNLSLPAGVDAEIRM